MITNFLISLILAGITVWLFIPVLFSRPIELDEFCEMYPNKYKRLFVLFLFGPSVWVVFGIQLISLIFEKFRLWLRK